MRLGAHSDIGLGCRLRLRIRELLYRWPTRPVSPGSNRYERRYLGKPTYSRHDRGLRDVLTISLPGGEGCSSNRACSNRNENHESRQST
jgi:hypothetical protein